MDFSPMHPDDWARTDAGRWHFYLQHRIEYEKGRDDVKARRGDQSTIDANMKKFVDAHKPG